MLFGRVLFVAVVGLFLAVPDGQTTLAQLHACDHPLPGVALDLDGVVRQGDRPCLEGLAAIVELQRRGVPFIFMTNGGAGRTEEGYARKLEKMLRGKSVDFCWRHGVEALAETLPTIAQLQAQLQPLHAEQFVLAYSPLPQAAGKFLNKTVLVVGASGSARVAREYSFKNAIHVNEYARRHIEIDPWNTKWVGETPPGCPSLLGDEASLYEGRHTWENVSAIFVMGEPNHFGQALQICVDILMSGNPMAMELAAEQTPIFFANNDLLWASTFPHPRFGTGAFKAALRAVLRARLASEFGMSNADMRAREKARWFDMGKPEVSQYHFAETKIDSLPSHLPNVFHGDGKSKMCIGQFFMVGDNHKTDILGASRALQVAEDSKGRRRKWKSVLVRTGVWKEGLPTHGATVIRNHVQEAVAWILQENQMEPPAHPHVEM